MLHYVHQLNINFVCWMALGRERIADLLGLYFTWKQLPVSGNDANESC